MFICFESLIDNILIIIFLIIKKIRINNNTFIKVNGQRILPPYVIKAIGNPTYLESELVGSGGYVDVLRKLGHDITIEPSDKVLINKIKEDITTKYIE